MSPLAFLIAVLAQAATATLEAIGLRHPLRLPVALAVWFVTWIFLGLPTVILAEPDWSDVVRYGNWRNAAGLAALLELGGLFIFHLLWAGPTVLRARRGSGLLDLPALVARGDELYRTELAGEEELSPWMEQVKAWTALCERELADWVSPDAADAFRRPTVMQVARHHQRLNDVHNAWLDLLAKRLEVLRALARAPRSRRRVADAEADTDPR
ncbi:MAG TPA: hypothetical protein VFD43_07940 [Planctomycetota bacterium]|nr:hypothetical protein [Planctomycetota bacterium]